MPRPTIGMVDAIALIVGIVIGAGIYVTPGLVAANTFDATSMVWAWCLGGVVALAGALCYAELAAAYPHAGGDYHYLSRAFGRPLALLFGWARICIIPTGSIALLAFAFGDYTSEVLGLGPHSSSIYAAAIIVLLTLTNMGSVHYGKRTQNVLTLVEVAALGAVILTGLALVAPAETAAPEAAAPAGRGTPMIGLAMVFVMLAYGGWNEASYISAEVRGRRHNLAIALIVSIAIITLLYVLVNLAFMRGLGYETMIQSQAVGADLMRRAFGGLGASLIALAVAVSALTSINATILFGARTSYAVGKDFAPLAFLGRWHSDANTPRLALLVQAGVSLALVLLGGITRQGVKTMIEFTAPVFWFFFLLTGIALFVLRRREPDLARPFRVPLYPLTPIVFCVTSAYLLYSSVMYAGIGSLVGVAVLGVGALLMLFAQNGGRVVPAPAAARAPSHRGGE